MKLDSIKRAGTIGLSVLGILGGLDSMIKGIKDLKGVSDSNDDIPAENKTDEEVKETDIVVEAEATPVVEEEEIE